MQNTLQIVYLAAILCSAITAFRYLDHIKSRNLAILAPFLLYVFVQELCLFLIDTYSSVASNTIVYHIYRVVNILVFAYVFYRVPFMRPMRKMIVGLAIVYILVNFMVFLFISSLQIPNSYLSLARGLVVSCYAIFFLFSYFNLDNPADEHYWIPLLWIVIGMLIFYPVISISLAFQKKLVEYGTVLFGFRLYRLIPQVMSVFMYSCFTYAFYLCKKKN